MEEKLESGDMVRIRRPNDRSEPPYWLYSMDMYDGTIVTVDTVGDDFWLADGIHTFKACGISCHFNVDWAELVSECEEDIVAEDMLSLFS